MEEIKITKSKEKDTFNLEVGDKIADELGYDEMLGLVSSLAMQSLGTCKPCMGYLHKKEKHYEPKDGDFVYVAYNGWNNMKNELLFISKEDGEHKTESYTMYDILEHQIRYDRYVCEDGHILSIRPATEEEKQLLLDALHKERNDCESKKEIVEHKWPRMYNSYAFVTSCGDIRFTIYQNTPDDQERVKIGNCFHNKEEGQPYADKIKELLKGE